MYSSRLIKSLLLYSVTSGSAIPIVHVEPVVEERQIVHGLTCLLGGVVILLKDIVGDSNITPFCQSVLGYTTSTVEVTSTITTDVTKTAFSATATAVSHATTVTVSPVIASPITFTVTGSPATVTACVASGGVVKRQINASVGLGLGTATGLTLGITAGVPVPTPTALADSSPHRISVVCGCVDPVTPDPVTSTVIQTAARTIASIVPIVSTRSDTVYVTPTITPTLRETYYPTSTVNYCPSKASPSCGNVGMEWSMFWFPYDRSYPSGNSNGPNVLKTTVPFSTGKTAQARLAGYFSGFCSDTNLGFFFYDAYAPFCSQWALVYRGFVYAAQSGDYTFSANTPVDDKMYAWVGDNAYVDYASNNTALYSEGGGTRGTVTYVYHATAGEFIPLRIQVSQGPGLWAFNFQVTGPNGTTILDGSGPTNAVVQFGCNGATRSFLPWGAETS